MLWLAATVLFRLTGQWFLVPDDTARMGAAYYSAIPLIAAVTLPLYHVRGLGADHRLRAAVLIALPGIMLDMVTTLVFERVFPNLAPEADGPFASWLFWAYGLILLSGFIPTRRPR